MNLPGEVDLAVSGTDLPFFQSALRFIYRGEEEVP